MSLPFQPGDSIVTGYTYSNILKENPVFLWMEALNAVSNTPVVVQILNPAVDWRQNEVEEVTRFFDRLQGIQRKGLSIPNQLLSDQRCPLALIYEKEESESMLATICQSPDQAVQLWRSAGDALHRLHNRQIQHGCVAPESFVIIDGKVCLTDFGYEPLLRLGHAHAIKHCQTYLAPEVFEQKTLSNASDIYALAQTIVSWNPLLKGSEWYRRSTEPAPNSRFQRVRDMIDAFEKALAEAPEEQPEEQYCLSLKPHPSHGGSVSGAGQYGKGSEVIIEARSEDSFEFDHWEGDVTGKDNPRLVAVVGNLSVVAQFAAKVTQPSGGLRIKHAVEVAWEPEAAGKVVGAGHYMDGKEVPVIAQANELWQFQEWTGDLSGAINPAKVVVDAPKRIVAIFSKAAEAILSVSVEPANSGSIQGGGRYVLGQEVPVSARAHRLWTFSHWSGDLDGSVNATRLILDADKTVTAHFRAQARKEVTVTADSSPAEGGTVKGGGKHALGDSVKVSAEPNFGWTFQRWSGDIGVFFQTANPVELDLNSNVTVAAHFQRDRTAGPEPASGEPEPSGSTAELIVVCDPEEGGQVTGAGTHALNRTVSIEAKPATGWMFNRWSGDLPLFGDPPTSNPLRLLVDRKKSVTAHFEKEANSPEKSSAQPSPPKVEKPSAPVGRAFL